MRAASPRLLLHLLLHLYLDLVLHIAMYATRHTEQARVNLGPNPHTRACGATERERRYTYCYTYASTSTYVEHYRDV